MILVRPHIIRPPTLAREFNGSSDYIETNASSLFNVTNLTVAAWINLSGSGVICARDNNPSGARSFTLNTSMSGSTGVTSFSVFKAVDVETNLVGSIGIPWGSWHHVAMTYQFVGASTSIMTNYVDGLQDAQTMSAVGPLQASATTLEIGRRQYSGFQNYFAGAISSVWVWSVALSLAEITRAMTNPISARTNVRPIFSWIPRTVYGPDLDRLSGVASVVNGTTPAPWQQRMQA